MSVQTFNSSVYLKHTSVLVFKEDNDSLQIPGYDLIRSDNPSNYKNFLPLKLIDINYLRESILLELQTGSKTC